MVIYRLALLNGNATRLSSCTVRGYVTLSSHPEQIQALARRMNALVCGWRAAQ